jgi:[histone H3]-lysine79 N-trimethyltransferase
MDSDASAPSPDTGIDPSEKMPTSNQPQPDYLRCIQRAINRHDGPLFVKTMYTINRLLRMLKYPKLPVDPFEDREPNYLMNHIRTWSFIPTPVVMRVVEEAYQRTVGPNVSSLHAYEAFSSHVYGELMPTFISDIVTATRLRPGKLLLDLGCGVGNVCIQASLQSGCDSYGIEILPAPAKIARGQLEHFRKRVRMWGLTMGNVELEEGDMLQSTRVNELMSKADVVLVNNKVFAESCKEFFISTFFSIVIVLMVTFFLG